MLCNCIGPQGSEPLCPCEMRGVKVIDGKYYKYIGEVKQPCLWEGVELDKPMGLSCPCPKCSMR